MVPLCGFTTIQWHIGETMKHRLATVGVVTTALVLGSVILPTSARAQLCYGYGFEKANYETANFNINICETQKGEYIFISQPKNGTEQDWLIVGNATKRGSSWEAYDPVQGIEYIIGPDQYRVDSTTQNGLTERVINYQAKARAKLKTCYILRPNGLYIFESRNSASRRIGVVENGQRIEVMGNEEIGSGTQRFIEVTNPYQGYIVSRDSSGKYISDCSP
ncbi:hypothetical protein [Okeania sp. SIO1I7]|uniref:hypothetical protein n=1 Tax=Okeania sp. SIO1I7 TaxID=2607772 RepID=UPI0013FC350C|nr:hypothetical protein [Okeania sp. SIO1I7]NET26777.1 hypothetical protein [Okeania sp. SIO1I7]